MLPESVVDWLTLEARIALLAHGRGKEVPAELVQTAATLQLPPGLGVDYAQGYWIAEPSPRALARTVPEQLAGTLSARPAPCARPAPSGPR